MKEYLKQILQIEQIFKLHTMIHQSNNNSFKKNEMG